MTEDFQLPARPWTEADIQMLMANQSKLDDETRAELGLAGEVEEAATPSEGEDAANEGAATDAPETTEGEEGKEEGDEPEVSEPADKEGEADGVVADEAAGTGMPQSTDAPEEDKTKS